MKTTLDISEPLLREARKIVARERTTLRALVEQGLRRIITEKARKPAFRLRDASFNGRGLNPEFADVGWDRLRDLISPHCAFNTVSPNSGQRTAISAALLSWW
jgi:hypothetical protein